MPFKKIINNAYIGTGCIDANLIDKLGISKVKKLLSNKVLLIMFVVKILYLLMEILNLT